MPHQNSQRKYNHLVIGITGRIAAGKTSVAEYLRTAHGFHYVRYSKVLSEWLAQESKSKTQLQAIGWEVMAGGMQAELNARLIAQIPARRDCAADGLRHSIDYDSLSQAFPSNFRLLYIESCQKTRWQRLEQCYPAFDDFERADSHPVEQQIEALRCKAFSILGNSSSLQELYSKVDAVLNELQSGGRL